LLKRRHGDLYVIKYLKASQLAIQKSIAGTPFKTLREIEPDLPFPRLTRKGLPVFIGTRDRQSIANGSISSIQFFLTIFGIYRVLNGPVKAKLFTITDPFSGHKEYLDKSLGPIEKLSTSLIRVPKHSLCSSLLFLQTSSPNSKVS